MDTPLWSVLVFVQVRTDDERAAIDRARSFIDEWYNKSTREMVHVSSSALRISLPKAAVDLGDGRFAMDSTDPTPTRRHEAGSDNE